MGRGGGGQARQIEPGPNFVVFDCFYFLNFLLAPSVIVAPCPSFFVYSPVVTSSWFYHGDISRGNVIISIREKSRHEKIQGVHQGKGREKVIDMYLIRRGWCSLRNPKENLDQIPFQKRLYDLEPKIIWVLTNSNIKSRHTVSK